MPSLYKKLALGLLPLLSQTAHAYTIVLTNDDGWAEKNIRLLYDALDAANESVVVSAPAVDQSSNTDSTDVAPVNVKDGCQYDSCPKDSPSMSPNKTDTRINYVNSSPVVAMRYGAQRLAESYFGGNKPDIVVSGVNVGPNLGTNVYLTGTAAIAAAAAGDGIPAISFNGALGDHIPWTAPSKPFQDIYAELAVKFTQAVLDSGKPYLPDGVWLNVNFPPAGAGACTKASDVRFALSRIFVPGASTPNDAETCGSLRLPTESAVAEVAGGCFASVSVGRASDKGDAAAADQAAVLAKLGLFLSCLP